MDFFSMWHMCRGTHTAARLVPAKAASHWTKTQLLLSIGDVKAKFASKSNASLTICLVNFWAVRYNFFFPANKRRGFSSAVFGTCQKLWLHPSVHQHTLKLNSNGAIWLHRNTLRQLLVRPSAPLLLVSHTVTSHDKSPKAVTCCYPPRNIVRFWRCHDSSSSDSPPPLHPGSSPYPCPSLSDSTSAAQQTSSPSPSTICTL